MMRLRGVPSEVLIMPLISGFMSYDIGSDITDISGVTKYVKQIPVNMSGLCYGSFPSFIPITDEELFQKVPDVVEMMVGNPFYSSVKVDGSSATVYQHEDHFGCCSRNIELKETEGNAIWSISKKYNLQEKLKYMNIALQFEIAGPGIQKNKLGLKEVTPFLFDIYSIEDRVYYGFDDFISMAASLDFPTVHMLESGNKFGMNNDDLLRKYAEGTYPNGQQREGVVIRTMEPEFTVKGNRTSFKVINLLYKD
jgi:RNA ligase (TIGR02306 family)